MLLLIILLLCTLIGLFAIAAIIIGAKAEKRIQKNFNKAYIMTKATPNICIDLENMQEELIGTVKPGEVLDGEARADGFFYFPMSQKVGKRWKPVECRLPIGANGVKLLEK